MDIYKLINSKAVSEHCRKIKHTFNIEEIAILIYRNKTMSIGEKIKAYQELINNYKDIKVIKKEHQISVKKLLELRIKRIQDAIKRLEENEQNVIYVYNYYSEYYNDIVREDEYSAIYTNFKDVQEAVEEEIKHDEEKEIVNFTITKRSLSMLGGYICKAEYIIDENGKLKMVNIYDFNKRFIDIGDKCLYMPTPFKKRRFINCQFYNALP